MEGESLMNAKESPDKPVCPRCGQLGGYLWARTVNDRKYYYWVHETKVNGIRRVKRCYLGPEKYYYGRIFLSGALDRDRFMRYVENLLKELNEQQKRWLLQALEKELYPRGWGLLKRLTRRWMRRA
jgi:hypothetical protein